MLNVVFICRYITEFGVEYKVNMLRMLRTGDVMNSNRDIVKVLLKLDDAYYEKGMKKISVSLNGIRSEKIPYISRGVIIPQLVRSKQYDKFIQQFIENLREELNSLINDDYIKAIIENPSESEKIEKISETNKQLLYLYLASLHNGKYENILQLLLENIMRENSNEINQNINIPVEDKEIFEIENKYKIYEDRIEDLKIIAKRRKDKINELETKLNIITDENEKMKQENGTLMLEIQNLKMQIENTNNTQCILKKPKSNEEMCEQKEKKANIVIVCNDKELIKNQDVIQITQMEFLLMDEKERTAFEQICIYRKGIHISKLRKIMQLAGEKANIFESVQELLSFINAMEDENENRSN